MGLLKSKKSFEETFMAKKKVILHFRRANQSLEGYLINQTDNSYILAKSQLIDEKAEFSLEGTVVVPRDDVFFAQVLGESQAL